MSATAAEPPLYKIVTPAGVPTHQKHFRWSIPRDGQPGDWHEIEPSRPLKLCGPGFHLTRVPQAWWRDGCAVYLAEVDGEQTAYDAGEQKVAVRRVRLLRRVSGVDYLAGVGVRIRFGSVDEASIFSGSGSGYGSGYGDGDGFGDGSTKDIVAA